ncbi:MAG: carbonic anhydrase [Chloroflexi bacterium]|nr:carbonic anhydrase [Chloroflexota bacterium]
MTVTDELLSNNLRFAAAFDQGSLPTAPSKHLAVVACMDSRMDLFAMLGLEHGEAHVIRNAGGIVTDDVIRSLMISQRLLGTREVILIHHTCCGLQAVVEEELKAKIQAEVGLRPPFSLGAFSDLDGDVRQSIALVRTSPFIPHREHVRGFVYDVGTGRLREVR